MAYEDKTAHPQQRPHRLTMDDRRGLWMNGVEEVESFHEEEVAVRTVQGLLYIRGTSLKVDKLEKNAGELNVSGQVVSLEYEDAGPRSGFWSRLFK